MEDHESTGIVCINMGCILVITLQMTFVSDRFMFIMIVCNYVAKA